MTVENAGGSREWNSEVYHRVSSPQVGWGQNVLSRLRLGGDETVIDGGCGTGRLTEQLLELLPRGHVVAVDLSQNMLREAREHLQPRFDGRVSFVLSDLQELPLSRVADAVFSTAALHWIKDHNQLFRSLVAALRPGGWLEAQCGGGPNLAKLLARAEKLMHRPPFAKFFNGWQSPWEFADAETTADRLRKAGFIEIRTWLESAPVVLSDAQHYREFLPSVIFRRHLECIPDPGLRTLFIDELTRAAAGDDPPFTLDYWRLNLSARRPE